MRRRRSLFTALAVAAFIPLGFAIHTPASITGNPDCTLTVPSAPLTAEGLATPYVLASAGVTCHENDPNEAAFVQATILDPATGALTVYNPVVVDDGSPTSPSTPPVLPANAVVTIWTGFNGNILNLTGPGHLAFTEFPQQAYANSPQFFTALNHAISQGLVTVPTLGTAKDGEVCPSSRDFSVVDQDQSDNNPQVNQFGIGNASDEKTLNAIDAALGCATWKANGVASGPLQEAQANADQGPPVAVIPSGDPFTFLHGQPDFALVELLRMQVDQPLGASASTTAYCGNLASVGEPRLKLDRPYEVVRPNTIPTAHNLADQLALRFQQTWANLGCQQLTGQPSPIQTTIGDDGLVSSATYA